MCWKSWHHRVVLFEQSTVLDGLDVPSGDSSRLKKMKGVLAINSQDCRWCLSCTTCKT